MPIKPVRNSKLVAFLNKAPKTGAKKGLKTTVERTDWVKTALNLAMEAGQEFWNEPTRYLRVSGIGDPCIRSLVLGAFGHNIPHDAKLLRIFSVGTLIGQVLADTFDKAGLLIEAEGTVYLEHPPITGHFDVYIKGVDEYEDEEFLGEIKSINDFSFDKLPEEHSFIEAGSSPLFALYENYITQWNTYSGLKEKVRGFILFESKNTQRHKVYWLEFDEKLFNRTVDKALKAEPYLLDERNIIPPVPADRNPHGADRVCGKCPRRYLCEILPKDGCTLEKAKELDAQLRG